MLAFLPFAAPPSFEQLADERVAQLARRRRRAAPVASFDDRDWPLVITTAKDDDDADDDVALLDCVTAAHLRGPFVLVCDARNITQMPAPRRRLAAATRAAQERHFPGVLQARAIVVGSEETRRALLAIGWLHTPACPVAYFTKKEDAVAWACARLPR